MKHYIMKINHDEVVIPKYEYYFYMWLDDFLRLNPGEKIIKTQTDIEGNEIDFRLFNKLFYIAKLPIMANHIKDNKILGGYNVSSGTERFRKNFYSLPSGVSEAKLRFKYYSIDSWDGEWGLFGFIAHNGTNFGEAGSWKIGTSYGGTESEVRYNTCGGSWVDAVFYGEAVVQTYGYPYLQIVAKSNLDSGPSDESFGIDKIEVWVR